MIQSWDFMKRKCPRLLLKKRLKSSIVFASRQMNNSQNHIFHFKCIYLYMRCGSLVSSTNQPFQLPTWLFIFIFYLHYLCNIWNHNMRIYFPTFPVLIRRFVCESEHGSRYFNFFSLKCFWWRCLQFVHLWNNVLKYCDFKRYSKCILLM